MAVDTVGPRVTILRTGAAVFAVVLLVTHAETRLRAFALALAGDFARAITAGGIIVVIGLALVACGSCVLGQAITMAVRPASACFGVVIAR